MLSLDKNSFSTDDFFAAIRAAYNKRGSNSFFQRLNFCIFGVAAPQDLMSDPERTPFNIGIPILLNNFLPEETVPLLGGLKADIETAQIYIDRIHFWTKGQPYLTQKLCQILSAHKTDKSQALTEVDEIVKQNFFYANVLSNDPHFSNIQNRIISNELYNLRMLELYRKLQKGEKVLANNQATEQLYLKLSGLVRKEGTKLEINNAIYEKVFDGEWLDGAYGSIKRPFATDLQRWLNSKRSQDALLVGTILGEAEYWADGRTDLTNEERDFLQASRLFAIRTEQEKLRQEEKIKQQRRLRIALILALITAIIAAFAGIYGIDQARIANIEKQNAKSQETLATNALDSLKVTQEAQRFSNYQRYLENGILRMEAGQYREAIIQFKVAMDYDSSNQELKELINSALVKAGISSEFENQFSLGNLALEKGDYATAIRHFSNAQKLNLDDARLTTIAPKIQECQINLLPTYRELVSNAQIFMEAEDCELAMEEIRQAKNYHNYLNADQIINQKKAIEVIISKCSPSKNQ